MEMLAGLFGLLLMVVFVLVVAALLISPLLFVRYRRMQHQNASLEARLMLQMASR